MGCSPVEDIGEPGLRIDAVESGGADQAVHDGGMLAAAIGSGEQPGLAAKSDAAQRPFCGIVGEADPPIGEEPGESVPALEQVVHGLGDLGVAEEPGPLLPQPSLQLGDQWYTPLLARCQALVGGQAVEVALDGEQGIDPTNRFERQGRDG
jgi:hypothetical protein